jgi:hypothetical protein
LSNVLVAIAAVALALGAIRSARDAWFGPRPRLSPWAGPPGFWVVAMARLNATIDAVLPSLALATVGLVALWLCTRRTEPARQGRQPGMVACGVASIFLAAPLGGAFLWVLGRGLTLGPGSIPISVNRAVADVYQAMADWGYLIGFAVAVAWVVLGLTRGWKPDPSAFDRAGRLLGLGWVVLAPLAMALKVEVLLRSLV